MKASTRATIERELADGHDGYVRGVRAVASTPRDDERRRIVENFSDEDLILWHSMFGEWPVRMSPERVAHIEARYREAVRREVA